MKGTHLALGFVALAVGSASIGLYFERRTLEPASLPEGSSSATGPREVTPFLPPSEGPLPQRAGEADSAAADPLHDRRHAGDDPDEDPAKLAALPTQISYPRHDKYADAVMSGVPHELVGAWDENAESGAWGRRRMFIAVVSPETTDADLEALVRDLRDRHRDADVLGVRVFDSRDAASRPSWTDGGASRDTHLVAELRRDVLRDREILRVRGRDLEL